MKRITVGIINVTGYAGVELARLLYRHPYVKLTSVTGRSAAGQRLATVFPHLSDIDMPIVDELSAVDLAFSAMPHKASIEAIVPLIEKNIKVVDISADFRLKDASLYPEWYDYTHNATALLSEAVYGLPELYRNEIATARLVANPGCYPTSAILALAPVIKEGMVMPDIIIDSKSGVSGAGRTLSLTTHFCEASDNVAAYSLKGHRHLPEIVQELNARKSGFSASVVFVPHLIPMTRGILSTCYLNFKSNAVMNKERIIELYREFYKGEPFVKVVSDPPGTKQTWGNNYCLIYPMIDSRTGKLIVISCLDNLVKGAAGQAIQNMNIMMGLPETAGLDTLAIYP